MNESLGRMADNMMEGMESFNWEFSFLTFFHLHKKTDPQWKDDFHLMVSLGWKNPLLLYEKKENDCVFLLEISLVSVSGGLDFRFLRWTSGGGGADDGDCDSDGAAFARVASNLADSTDDDEKRHCSRSWKDNHRYLFIKNILYTFPP